MSQVVKYTLTAKNTGNVTLHNVTVTDSPALDGYSCTPSTPTSLAPGDSIVCIGTHKITQGDLDSGSFKDTATASSTETGPTTKDDTILANQNPKLDLAKTDNLNPAMYTHAGQVVTYTLTATNNGNVTLHNVTVTDNPTLDAYSCSPSTPTSLAPGASIICTGTHTITQGEMDAGSFKDTGTANSTETGPTTKDDTIFSKPITQLSVDKKDDLNPNKYDHVGQVVTYTLTATNTGNVTLHNVTLTDDPSLDGLQLHPDAAGDPGSERDDRLHGHAHDHPGRSGHGSFKDTATASSTEAGPKTKDDTIQAAQNPTLSVTKTDDLNPTKYDHAGQVVTYTLTAKNTGNVTLHNVTLTDDPSLAGYNCTPTQPATLAPNESIVCTGTHTITLADMDSGSFKDTATASSTETGPKTKDDTILADQKPKLDLTKGTT